MGTFTLIDLWQLAAAVVIPIVVVLVVILFVAVFGQRELEPREKLPRGVYDQEQRG